MQPFILSSRFWQRCSLVAALGFGGVAVLYMLGGPLERLDYWLGAVLHDLLDMLGSRVTRLVAAVSWFGGTGALLVTAAALLFLSLRRSWREVLLLALAVGSAVVLNRLLKEAFETVRPMVGHLSVAEESTGFPSGHTMVAVVVYGTLAFLVTLRESLRQYHTWAWIGAGVVVCLISFTRLLLSVHYLSDVLGGLAAGISWLGLCLWAFTTLYQLPLTIPH